MSVAKASGPLPPNGPCIARIRASQRLICYVRPGHPAGDAGSGPARPTDREGDEAVNKVLLTGRLTRDPEMRSLAFGQERHDVQ